MGGYRLTQFVEAHFKKALYIAVVFALLLAGKSWLAEHDGNLMRSEIVKAAEAKVQTLQGEVMDLQKAGAAQKTVIIREAAAVKTPMQAIAAIPSMTDAPLNARSLPDAPSAVSVDAVPLFQELTRCKVQGVDLNTCQATAEKTGEIVKEKDLEIQALKHPKGFWKRLGKSAKIIGCAAGGGLVGGMTRGPMGAAIGAGTGASVCTLF